jgi:hypothetical protein
VPSLKLRRVLVVSGVAAAMIASSTTAEAQQYEARTVAPRTIEHTAQGELMLGVTGAVLMGIPYAASVWAASQSNREGDKLLYVPLVGPFAAFVDRNVCTTPGCRGNIANETLPLVASSIAQGAGLALIIIAASTPTTRVSAPPPASPTSEVGGAHLTLHVVPASYDAGAGIAAFGTF